MIKYVIPVIFIFSFTDSALAEPLWICMDSQSGVETFTHNPKSSDSVKCSPFDERQAKPMPIEKAQPKSVKNKKQKSTSSVKRKPTPKPVTMAKKKSTKRRY